MRSLVCLLLFAVLAACGSTGMTPPEDPIDAIAARWPEDVGTLEPFKAETNEAMAQGLLKSDYVAEVADIAFYRLDGDLAVWILRGRQAFTLTEVLAMRCGISRQFGEDFAPQRDTQTGDQGLHGSESRFALNVDGVMVLVMGMLAEEHSHDVARALGAEDDSEDGSCASATDGHPT